MKFHESKLQKQKAPKPPLSMNTSQMSIEVKSKESSHVNTPKKKTEILEQKMLERNNGIETFGRQKINSDKKLYKVDRLENHEKGDLDNSLDH